jgi:hypothetical protein
MQFRFLFIVDAKFFTVLSIPNTARPFWGLLSLAIPEHPIRAPGFESSFSLRSFCGFATQKKNLDYLIQKKNDSRDLENWTTTVLFLDPTVQPTTTIPKLT